MKKYTKVLPDDAKKSVFVQIRLSPAELAKLDDKARAEGMSRSAYVRYKAIGR